MTVDLRHRFPPVFDQGRIGSCTANAICALIGFMCPGFHASRLFLYYNERLSDGAIGRDDGVEVCRAFKSLVRFGACCESLWPYLPARLDVRPDRRCYERVRKFKASAIPNESETLKRALNEDHPFVIGLVVYESFKETGTDGKTTMPRPGKEKCLGGHAVVCVGYRDDDLWIMRNCWGTGWGDDGHFYLPSSYLFDPSLTCSAPWCLQGAHPPSDRRSESMGRVPRRG